MKNKLGALVLITALLFTAGSSLFSQTSGDVKGMIKGVQDAIKAKGAKWVAGETPLSDLPESEQMLRVGLNFEPIKAPPITDLNNKAALPAKLDWRNYKGNDFVSGVRNQGKCGSCWAFAMTAGLEAYVLRTQNRPNTDIDLSEQVLISCSGVGSCNGGTLNASFLSKTGLPEESFYPYTATDGTCSSAQPSWQNSVYTIGSYGSVKRDLNTIKAALVKYGPLPTAMMVYEDFMHYKSGIYSYTTGKKLGGHAVFLVGYDDAEQYFIVKNSWSDKWGESGYFKIAYSEMDSSVNFGLSTIAYKSTGGSKSAGEFVGKQFDPGVNGDEKTLENIMPIVQPALNWK